jgi:hypothetical protein
MLRFRKVRVIDKLGVHPGFDTILGGTQFKPEGLIDRPVPTHPSSWRQVPFNTHQVSNHANTVPEGQSKAMTYIRAS